jgi:uncharacterized membrane protein
MIKAFVISFISFVILDFLWLGFVVKSFSLRQLSEIGRIKDGELSILYVPAGVVYVSMAAMVTLFILPKISVEGTWTEAFSWGALMGLFVYSFFDMTNLSILKNYPLPFSLADIAWGTFAFGLVSLLAWKYQ